VQLSNIFDPRRLLAYSGVFQTCQKCMSRGDTVGRLAREFLKIGPGQRVLDIGCGTANILAYLPPDVDYHGYDLNPDYVATARARYGSRGTFEVRAVSPEAVPGSQQFDVVLAIGVLHHLDDD